ncbi:MAG TPA: J domain-containing protein [Baekduia sp.]|nr:J domain-containing protein [Baekduia sp.]
MDPHAVLGLAPDASPEEVQRAYRALAKRFHPDRAGEGGGELMISINAAYDLLRDQLSADAASQAPAPPSNGAEDGAPQRPRAGDWLPPRVRRVLARELLRELEPGEEVDEVVLTSTGDSHDVQLAVTDRRLLWLRDDAIMGRVRYLRYRDLRHMETRPAGRLRRRGQLRVQAISGRRLRFFDLRPEVLDRVAAAVSARAGR